jgi:NadR type nicotinamide-nucleotide adenylyltransferase
MQLLKKIVVIGPESTGKSTLCEQLAAHYGTVWTPEYAREYLLTKGTEYTYADLLVIAKGQLALEDAGVLQLGGTEETGPEAGESSRRILFIDTDLYVMKVWSEFVFGKCDPWILDQIGSRQYDGYLLCKTDIPWTPDALREYPDLETREKLFHIYKDCLVNQSTPWAEIGGQADERLAAAIDAVKRLVA